MRIISLNLIAYGHFDNKSLQFGKEPGFDLIYGDNEAGKTTALRALSSVLFGYPHNVVDGFKFDPKDMVLGADLINASGTTLSLIRRRRGQRALTTSDGKSLDQNAVASFFGGVGQETFERVFALDHERLREHAQSLLAEGGEMGISLAEAGSGIAGLKGLLDRLLKARNDLFLPGGSKPPLNRLLSELSDFRAKARRFAVSVNEYKKREKEIDGLSTAIDEARARASKISKEVRRLERIQRTLPQKAQHAAIESRLAELWEIPDLPENAVQRRIKAQSDFESATTDLDIAVKGLDELNTRVNALHVDEAILERKDEIDSLSEIRPVVENADRDLPKRSTERNQHCESARALLVKAELVGDPEHLGDVLPSGIKRKAIEQLAKKVTTLAGQFEGAKNALTIAANALESAKEKEKNTIPAIDVSELDQVWRKAEKLGPISEQIEKRRRALDRMKISLKEGIVSLGFPTGGTSELRSYSVPAQKTIERYKTQLADNNSKTAAAQAGNDRLNGEIKSLSRQIHELVDRKAVLTMEEVIRRRHDRDESWSLIRDAYITNSTAGQNKLRTWKGDVSIPDHFEHQIADADFAADKVREHATDAAALSIAKSSKSEREAELSMSQDLLNSLTRDKQTLTDEWSALWGPLSIPVQSPEEMLEWVRKREGLLEEGRQCESIEEEIADLDSGSTLARTQIATALKKIGQTATTETLNELRQAAGIILERNTTASTKFDKAKQAVETQESNHTAADKAVRKLQAQSEDLAKEWSAALTVGGLRSDLTVDSATLILGYINELDGLKGNIDTLDHRIATMKQDRDCFVLSLAPLADLMPQILGEDAMATCRRLEAALKAAEVADVERNSLKEQVTLRTSAKRAAEEKLQRANSELQSLCKMAGCTIADELPTIEQQSAEKWRITLKREEIEIQLRDTGDGLSIIDLFGECENVNADEIPSLLAGLGGEKDELDIALETNVAGRAELRKELEALLGGDQAADYMQSAAIVQTQAADATMSYVELTVLEALLRQAIDIYRDRNQGPILSRAKTLFFTLTDGAYKGLRADVDDKAVPILIAEHPERGSLDIDALSDGTVDPLYLALRLGAVQEYNATHEPLPFVADDLLPTLGNRRTRATMKALGEIARDGQVLFFTHHEHMIDLAREVLPKSILREHVLA